MPVGASGISIDSRNIEKNQLFVAIEGPNFDGHDYVAEAFEKGSAGAIVEKYPQIQDSKRNCGAIIKVKSTQKALLEMSRHWRNSFPDLKVAAHYGFERKNYNQEHDPQHTVRIRQRAQHPRQPKQSDRSSAQPSETGEKPRFLRARDGDELFRGNKNPRGYRLARCGNDHHHRKLT